MSHLYVGAPPPILNNLPGSCRLPLLTLWHQFLIWTWFSPKTCGLYHLLQHQQPSQNHAHQNADVALPHPLLLTFTSILFPILLLFLHFPRLLFAISFCTWLPPPVPTARQQRLLAWNLAHKLSFLQFPVLIHQRLLFPLLRALITHLIHRLLARGLHFTLARLLRQLWTLLDINWLLLLILQYYPELLLKQVPLHVASKGLGQRGKYLIPLSIWHKFVSPDLEARLSSFTPPSFPSKLRPSTAQLLSALARDNFLNPCSLTLKNTLTAFLRPKTEEKAAFIADLRALNHLTPDPLPKFQLPSLDLLAQLLATKPPGYFWGITFDISNFYWSLRLTTHPYFAPRI